MISIIEVLDKNKAEAIAILKAKENKQIDFAKWDDEAQEYVCEDDGDLECEDDEDLETACPYIRAYYSEMVVSVRYNDSTKSIEIQSTSSSCKKAETWYSLAYAEEISFWEIYEAIGKHA